MEEALAREALRLNARFLEEVVEALDLCPWSRPARQRGEVLRHVWTPALEEGRAVPAELGAWIEGVAADAGVAVALLICPRGMVDAEAWRGFAERVRVEVLEAPGRPRHLAVAAFHPELPWSAARPASLVPLFRRSPDPTLQLVRLEVLRGLAEKGDGEDRYGGADALERLLRGELPAPRPSISAQVAAANAARGGGGGGGGGAGAAGVDRGRPGAGVPRVGVSLRGRWRRSIVGGVFAGVLSQRGA
jgi:hypothetical protein